MQEQDFSDREKVRRAFAIADEAMIELLRGHCVMAVGLGDNTLFPTSEDGGEVCRLAEAGSAIVEAMDWLVPRGLASVHADATGQYIVVNEDNVASDAARH